VGVPGTLARMILPETMVATVLAAAFTFSPGTPAPGQDVLFESTVTEPAAIAWDLDNDGAFDDAEGRRAKRAFPAGSHLVRMRARHQGQESVAEQTVQVGAPETPTSTPTPTATPTETATPPANRPPTARLASSCAPGRVCDGLYAREGQPHAFDASPSNDPDGTIAKYEWDVDGRPGYDATTTSPHFTHTFERNALVDTMKRTVHLRVTDDHGATAETELTLTLLEPTCERTVTLGRIRATGDCLRRHGDRYVSKNPTTVNGIAITPKPNRTITIEPGKIASNGATATAAVKGALATLADGAFTWNLPDGKTLPTLHGTLNGLKITQGTGRLNADGSATLALRVALPQQFGAPTSDDPITFTTGKATASSDPLHFKVGQASIGPIDLESLEVTFDGEDLWTIAASIHLPEPLGYTIAGDAGIRGGAFEHAGASVKFGTPGIGPLGPVFVQRIAFRIELNPKKSACVPHTGVEVLDQRRLLHDITGRWFDVPDLRFDWGVPTFALCGEVGLTAGPTVLGAAAIGLDAGLGLATYADRPSVLRAHGNIRLVEIPLADAQLELYTNGYTRMHAQFDWGIPDLASIKGFLQFEMLAPKFNAQAHVDACLDFVDWCAGARAIVSSKGLAVCLSIDVIFDDWTPGFGYRWGEALPTLYFSGCDVGDYREHIDSGGAGPIVTAAQAGTHEIDLPDGLPGATIVATGKDAPPKLTLVGPKGERVTSPDGDQPLLQRPFFVMKDPRAKLTQFAIAKPSAGRWKVIVEDGTLVSLKSAEGLDKPKIEAKVVKGKTGYRLDYDTNTQVTFLERGASTGAQLGKPVHGRGRIGFTPAPGAGETRTIVALVEGRGEYEVATYRAPAVKRPGRVRGLQATRHRVSWRDGGRHEVRIAHTDGRTTIKRTTKRALTLRNARRVQVRKLADGLAGPFSTRRVR
jgi:hypothetical protein